MIYIKIENTAETIGNTIKYFLVYVLVNTGNKIIITETAKKAMIATRKP